MRKQGEGENETVKGAKGILIILSDHIYVYSALTFFLLMMLFFAVISMPLVCVN